MRAVVGIVLLLLGAAGDAGLAAESALARGETAWTRRAEGAVGSVASPQPIAEAISAFEDSLATDPSDLAARTWLLKALWFQGEHLGLSVDEMLPIFERGRDLAQEAVEQLAASVGGDPRSLGPQEIERLRNLDYAAETYFWAAAHWGLWGRYRGKIASARQGVAGKIRDYAVIAIALDDRAESAGGHRILGRLHTEAPKLPFVTGWVDRREAVRQLEIAIEIAPHDMMNELYLLEALIEFDEERRDEAIARLREFVERPPRPETRIEDLKILADAAAVLDQVE